MYERLISTKDEQIETLTKENTTKSEEIKKIYELLENQQRMAMHTQLQIEKIQLQLEEGAKRIEEGKISKLTDKKKWFFFMK